MSIKIYDAYRIKAGTDIQRKEMLDFIRNKIRNRQLERLISLIEDEITQMDEVKVADHYKEYERIEKYLNYTSLMMNSPNKNMNNLLLRKPYDKDAVKKGIGEYLLSWVLRRKIEGQIEYARLDNTIMTLEYSFDNSIVIFPYNTKYTILMVFGEDIRNLFNELVSGDNEFKEKYELIDYHYQNSTDRPANITEMDWENREKVWSKIMPSGVPSTDGIVISMDYTNDDYFKSYPKALKNIKLDALDTRIEKQAAKRIEDVIYKNERIKLGDDPSPSDMYAVYIQIKEKIKNKDKDIMTQIEQCKHEISDLIVEITKDYLCNTKISDICPNYMSYY